jgi:hypothetical protein
MENDFRIGVRDESMAQTLQFLSQFNVIVNFAVESEDRIARLLVHGLAAGLKVDNLEPRRANGTIWGDVYALLIGAAV